ncbi:MAG: hypothetical protein AAGC92_04485 [Pseudomonadota bacterium]
MSSVWAERHGFRVSVVLALILVAGAALASPGLFIIDEVIYWLSALRMAETGSFTVIPAGGPIAHEALHLWLMTPGETGLVPQYPAGMALLGAPMVALFGAKGLILLNALAAAATVLLTYRFAHSVTGNAALALQAVLILVFASFFAEYALGVWPHAISTACVTAALFFGYRAIEGQGRTVFANASYCGLAVGLGFLFRVDTVLVLPALSAAGILYAAAPVRCAIGGAAGLAPPLLASALIAQMKFGSFNPLSYGHSDGEGIELANYIGLALVLLLALSALVAARYITWQPRWRTAALLGVAGLCATGAVAPLPGDPAAQLLHGVHALLVDIRVVDDPRSGVVLQPDGTLSFWGLWKKALGQSLPWAGLVPLLLLRAGPGLERPAVRLLLFACAVWMLPFLLRAWHGGLGSNMRYFLPILPSLAILAALAWQRLPMASKPTRPAWVVAWLGMGLLAPVVWALAAPSGLGGAHQVLPVYVLAAVVAAMLYSSLSGRAGLVRAAFLAGLGVAALLGPVADLAAAQARRAQNSGLASAYAALLPAQSLFVGPTELATKQLARPGALAALPERRTGMIDPALVRAALDKGLPVFIPTAEAQVFLRSNPPFAGLPPIGPASRSLTGIVRSDRPLP